jgi:hypothetical protein
MDRNSTAPAQRRRILLLFDYDWDGEGFARHAATHDFSRAGFDLFSFPSNVRLAGFRLERFVDRLAKQAARRGWQGVVSHHEQFGALAAALLAERMGWPGTAPEAVLACQHKLHARRVLATVCPEANVPHGPIDAVYGGPIPDGLIYPLFAKPVKAAFSVLARRVASREELTELTRFGRGERWIIERLVEPFERIARRRLPDAGSAHRLMWEAPVAGTQFNLDGYVWNGETRAIGVVDAVMYPGTQAFMRFDYPSRLPAAVQARACEVAARFLAAIDFRHGLFNMEFFYDAASDRLTVIEFNPRLASQLADLYRRVDGRDLHAMSLALACGEDPAAVPRLAPSAGAAASFVFRHFDPSTAAAMPDASHRQQFAATYPDGLLLAFPKAGTSLARDYKWLGSHRYAVMHLGGRDEHDLEQRCRAASALLGWPAPYASSRPVQEEGGAAMPPGVAISATS